LPCGRARPRPGEVHNDAKRTPVARASISSRRLSNLVDAFRTRPLEHRTLPQSRLHRDADVTIVAPPSRRRFTHANTGPRDATLVTGFWRGLQRVAQIARPGDGRQDGSVTPLTRPLKSGAGRGEGTEVATRGAAKSARPDRGLRAAIRRMEVAGLWRSGLTNHGMCGYVRRPRCRPRAGRAELRGSAGAAIAARKNWKRVSGRKRS